MIKSAGFEFTNRHGLKIRGLLEQIDDNRKLAFIMHGLSGNKEQPHIKVLRQEFITAGYGVVSFDCTHSFGESEGAYEDVTLSSYIDDLEDVVAWAKNQSWFQRPFALAGHSMGGYAVVHFAEKHPDLIDVLVAFAPVVSGRLWTDQQEKNDPKKFAQWKATGILEEESTGRPGLVKRLPWTHVLDRFKYDLLPDANDITAATLIVVGSEDHICLPVFEQRLYERLTVPTKKLAIVEDAPHTFRSHKDLQGLGVIVKDWLREISND